MRWSLRLIRIAGIGVYLHVTFLILLIWIGWSGYAMRGQWKDALAGIVFILTLFIIVLLHELGHALMAKRFGIRTRDITLLPIGGVARLERMPEDPRQELAVALAGPAVNVVLAIVFFGMLVVTGQWGTADASTSIFRGDNFLWHLVRINVALAVFNMIPAFPMDGGRVLRALLAIRMNYVRATRIAAKIGQGMAMLFVVVGLLRPDFFILILIAAFVWMGAAQESGFVQVKSALAGVPVSQVMITDFRTLAPDDALSRAVEILLGGHQQDFPVLNSGELAGLLTRSSLMNGLTRLDLNMPVADAMERSFPTAHPDEMAEDVLPRLQSYNGLTMPVVRDGRLLGMLTAENVREFLMVQAALHGELKTRRTNVHMAERHA